MESIPLNTTHINSEYALSDDDSDLVEKNTLIWGFFLIGVVVGFVAVYIVVAQPMFSQLGQLQRQMAALDSDMQLLVGARNHAWEAGQLLSDLNSLKGQIREARANVRDIRSLRQDLMSEALRSVDASESLARLAEVQDLALLHRDDSGIARGAVDELVQIQQRLVAEHANAPKVEETMIDLQHVRRQLSELLALAGELVRNGAGTAAARSTAEELISLKDQIVAHGQNTEAARSSANRLFILQDELKAHGDDLADAFASLDRLVDLKDKLADETRGVADAVQNLELLTDFREALGEQIGSLTQMREALLQIVMMESTIGRVAKLMEPLSQIANVRRLSDQDLRAAARSILENRTTRISSKPETPRAIPNRIESDPFDAIQDQSSAPSEEHEGGIVPPPMPLPVTSQLDR
jgi:hypothetical protein